MLWDFVLAVHAQRTPIALLMELQCTPRRTSRAVYPYNLLYKFHSYTLGDPWKIIITNLSPQAQRKMK